MSKLFQDNLESHAATFSDGRRMVVKENKEAEDPLTRKWKRASFRKSSQNNLKLKNKLENMRFN